MNTHFPGSAFVRSARTSLSIVLLTMTACLLMMTNASADTPVPKTVIVIPEGDAIIEKDESTFDFSGTAVAVDSTVAAVEWRNNAGGWNTATGNDLWSFTATDLVIGANKIDVRSRNAEGTNSILHSRTITRKPTWGITCDDPTEITENGFYAYDLTIFPRAWHRFTTPESGIVTVESENRLSWGGCEGGNETIGSVFHNRSMPTPRRVTVVAGQVLLFSSSRHSGDSPVGGFLFTFEATPVQSQNTCEEAMEIANPGSYHFTMGWTISNPCAPAHPDLGKGFHNYTTWYRFTAPQDGLYEFSLRQNQPILSEADFLLAQTDASFTLFPGNTCELTCNDSISWESSSLKGAVLQATEGSTYYIALTNPWEEYSPGYGILDVALGPTPPQGEVCTEAIEITTNGIHDFSNMDALLGDPCRTGSRTQWFSFTAPDNGVVLVETCGLASFDTFVSAFAGDCPLTCADRIVYNDDAAGPCGLQSRIEFAVQQGQTYKIAFSGFATERGTGAFLFDFSSITFVLGDIIGNGHVNVADVTELARRLANGNPPPIYVGDINGDGMVNQADVHALAEMIVNDTD